MFGGALWHRNVELASPYLLALRTVEAQRALAEAPGGDWQGVFHHVCQTLVGGRAQGRGVVDPNARAVMAPQAAYAAPTEGMIGQARRYLHPFLTISASGGIALAKDTPHEAAVLAA